MAYTILGEFLVKTVVQYTPKPYSNYHGPYIRVVPEDSQTPLPL